MACCRKVPTGHAARVKTAAATGRAKAKQAASAAKKGCPPGGCPKSTKKIQPKKVQPTRVKPCNCH